MAGVKPPHAPLFLGGLGSFERVWKERPEVVPVRGVYPTCCGILYGGAGCERIGSVGVCEETAGQLFTAEFAVTAFHLCFYAVTVLVAGDDCGDDDTAVFRVGGRVVSGGDAIVVCFQD